LKVRRQIYLKRYNALEYSRQYSTPGRIQNQNKTTPSSLSALKFGNVHLNLEKHCMNFYINIVQMWLMG